MIPTAGFTFDPAEVNLAIIIAVQVALAAVTVLVVMLVQKLVRRRRARRHTYLSQFGTEYLRALESGTSRRHVEEDLVRRRERRAAYELSTLHVIDRNSFRVRWDDVERSFVHGPEEAARTAVGLVVEVAAACGYPASSEEACLDDVSVDHPLLVADLRRARSDRSRLPDTDRHREVVLRARILFDRLLDVATPGPAPGASPVLRTSNGDGEAGTGAGGSSVSASARSTSA